GSRDLFDLLPGYLAHLLTVRARRAFVDARGLLQKIGSRRRLGDERKGAVRVDRYHHRYVHIDDARSLGVKRLAELHDVYAVLTKRGTDWRRGIRFPGRDLKLDIRSYLLCHNWVLCEPASP